MTAESVFKSRTLKEIYDEIREVYLSDNFTIAEPTGNQPEKWFFTHKDYERIGSASRFKEELEINIPGAALALQLLEDIKKLRN